MKKPWVKVVTRKVGLEFNLAICKSNTTLGVPSYWYDNTTYEVWYRDGELEKLGQKLANLALKDPSFIQKETDDYKRARDNLIFSAAEARRPNHKLLSNHQLAGLILKFSKAHQNFFRFMTTPHGVDRYCAGKLKLSVPVGEDDPERVAAMLAANYLRLNKKDATYNKLLDWHTSNYCWLSCWELGADPLGKEYFEKEIRNLAQRNKTSAKAEILSELLRRHVSLRTERKNTLCQANYLFLPAILEAGGRLGLAKTEVLLLSFQEISESLAGGFLDARVKEAIKKRANGWATCQDGKGLKIITGREKIFVLRKKLGITEEKNSGISKVKGMIASRGRVVGTVRVVLDISELDKVKKGDILVARMTTPDFVLAMNRCAGIITDEGGATCHAAIVSRELRIPCITGTHTATRVFKDGDLVKLDAINGSAKIIKA